MGQPLTGENIQRLTEAVKILETGELYKHSVRVAGSLLVTVRAGNILELHGRLPENCVDDVKILPRPSEQLPTGLRIVSADVCSDRNLVRVVLHNSARRDVKIDTNVVLADLHTSTNTELEALVGPSLETTCDINGSRAKCLIDSGNQVSIMAQSFFREHFETSDLEQLDTSLHVLAAGGHTVPYLGFVRVTVALPPGVVEVSKSVNTLMLVCPDTDFSQNLPVIIDTNTLRLFAQECEQRAGRNYATTLPLRDEVAFLYTDLTKDDSGRLGSAKLLGHDVVVPAGETVEVSCFSRISVPRTRHSVLVQEPTVTPLLEGLKVVACKVSASC